MKISHPGVQPSSANADALIHLRKKQICDILEKLGAASQDYFDCGQYINCIIDVAYNLGAVEQMDQTQLKTCETVGS